MDLAFKLIGGVDNDRNLDPYDIKFADDFGKFLLKKQALDELALQRTHRAAEQSGERFDHVLTKLGLISDNQLWENLALFLKIQQVQASELPEHAILVDQIPEKFISSNRLLPISINEDRLTLATADPLNLEPVKALAYSTGKSIELKLITPALFEKAWVSLYGNQHQSISILDTDSRFNDANDFDLQRLKDIANEAPVVRRVSQIISDAIELKASDIHIEPSIEAVHIRYRIDGTMQNAESLSPGLKSAIASRIKIMAQLDIAERRLPQDGRIKLAVRGVDIDFRVSTLPTVHGESIVLRILDRSQVSLDFESLGFENDTISSLRKIMKSPNGIILVTGPTGSGKTTTLYAALRELSKPDVKVFTVEDPIEYQLSGVNQVQVQSAIGLDFPNTLRAILRQDPDIIMIGEIRDAETAKIAIQASLTGHLVFSTLHTNSAVASITRLIDMGVESYLIASTVKAVLAQRLVRRLCEYCTKPLDTRQQWIDKLFKEKFDIKLEKLSSSQGCVHCRELGYAGRSTIAELMIMDDRMQRLICERAPDIALEDAARANGMCTLFQSGMKKAWRGETSVDEVMRVTQVE